MKQCIHNRRRLFLNAALIALALIIFALPTTRNVLACAVEEFAEITERILQVPCTLLDHDRCFTLDRFDPTCPQCL